MVAHRRRETTLCCALRGALGLAWLLATLSPVACANQAESRQGGPDGSSHDKFIDGTTRSSADDSGAVVVEADASSAVADSDIAPREDLGSVRDAGSVAAKTDSSVSDASAPRRSCSSTQHQLTDDPTDKTSVAAAMVGGAQVVGWVAQTSVALAELNDGNLVEITQVDAIDLSDSFDPHVLLVGDANTGTLFISDASRLRGVSFLSPSVAEEALQFDIELPLVDARALWFDGKASVSGIDVFQGCGLFVRSALVEPGLEPTTTMSECLVNFSGALSDTVVDGDWIRMLVGERLMSFRPEDGTYEEYELHGSAHRWQQRAVMAWARGGLLITADPDEVTTLERLNEEGEVLDRTSLAGAVVEPAAVEKVPHQGALRWVGLRGEEPDQEIVVSEAQVELDYVSAPLAIAKVSHPRDVHLIADGDNFRVFWLDDAGDVQQVFMADVNCTVE